MKYHLWLAHLFLPHKSNNHKAKILHSSSLLLFSAFFFTYQALLQFLPATGLKILGYAANISPVEVVRLTNEKRNQAGMSSLEYHDGLSSAAYAKGRDMLEKGYWAHVSPDGTQPWKFFADVGYKYRYAGENLARDFSNPSSAVEAWMASPTHKDNLLSPKYSHVGIAVVEGDLDGVDTTIIVQLFGTPYVDTVPVQPLAEKPRAELAQVPEPTPTPFMPIEEETSEPLETFYVLNTLPDQDIVYSAPGPVVTTPPTQVADYFKVSPFNITKGLSLLTVSLLLIVLVIDGVVTSRRRIYRIGGRTLGHIAFMGMILAVVWAMQAGRIL